ncbi:helix-turn-helix domain-containing protein [Companilactobacillus furfuricola]|uniref:helix-turn-helix domain-containing protein n=1 Tax=Companilactobacillus furfuricola TaxID=1462575 RepID=UPI0013DE25BA|nr:helix-turn-helix transcriptional regulator [Companilactobacillus furfuricola]
MFLGSEFKKHRLAKKLNQLDVSRGICSQAFISKIENLNISPSVDVLLKLCQRVDLSLNDLFSEFSNLPSNNFINDKIRRSDLLFQNGDYLQSKDVLLSLDISSLTKVQNTHIHFVLGLISSDQDLDEAIFQFNFTLQSLDNKSVNFWKFMAYVGLANAYLKKEAVDKQQYYMKLADQYFIEFDLFDDLEFYYFLSAITELAAYFTAQNDSETAEKYIRLGINPRHGYLSAEFTDKLFFLAAQNAKPAEQNYQAKISHSLTMAIAFADFNKNQVLLDQINDFMQQNNIRELKIKP